MIGFRIAALRKRMGLSQEQLAKRINVCASTIGMYEQGRREPSAKILADLAKVFEVSLDYLITGMESQDVSRARIAGILFVFQDDQPSPIDTLFLTEIDVLKIKAALQQHLLP